MAKSNYNAGEKIDKRILYTKMVLKDAFLNELKKKSYEKIGIVKLCDSAQISRSAFYLHYDSLDDLLREIIIEALENESGIIKLILGNYGADVIEKKDFDRERDIYDIEPDKYNVLVHHWTAVKIIIEIISEKFRESYISDVVSAKGISKEDAEALFFFQMAGFLTAVDKTGEDSLTKINAIRAIADKIIDNVQLLEK